MYNIMSKSLHHSQQFNDDEVIKSHDLIYNIIIILKQNSSYHTQFPLPKMMWK